MNFCYEYLCLVKQLFNDNGLVQSEIGCSIIQLQHTDIISSAAKGSGTGFEYPLPINKPIRHACAYWTSTNLGRETEEIQIEKCK